MLHRTRKGFTLAELLIVIAIVVILVGVSIPLISNSVSKANNAKCLHEMDVIRSAYIVEASNYGFDVDDCEPLITKVLADYGGTKKTAITYEAECGGTCTITYADDLSCILTIRCSEHGMAGDEFKLGNTTGLAKAEKGIATLFNEPTIRAAIDAYVDRLASGNAGSLDSTGINYGQPINSLLSVYGYNYPTWKVLYNKSKGTYRIYWASDNINACKKGDIISYLMYEYNIEDGKQTASATGKVAVDVKTINDRNGVPQTFNVMSEDTNLLTIDSVYGSSWSAV